MFLKNLCLQRAPFNCLNVISRKFSPAVARISSYFTSIPLLYVNFCVCVCICLSESFIYVTCLSLYDWGASRRGGLDAPPELCCSITRAQLESLGCNIWSHGCNIESLGCNLGHGVGVTWFRVGELLEIHRDSQEIRQDFQKICWTLE